MTTRSIVIALVGVLALTWSGPASAQQSKCLAGKTKCVSKKAGGLLKCEQNAETPGKPANPNDKGCVDKVVTKFDGGTDPSKGCFEKLEGKSPNDCITFNDTAAAEAVVDSCVSAFVLAIDPAPITQTKCGAGKKKCVAKYLGSLLKCQTTAQTPGKPTDPNSGDCIDKAQEKYTGGSDPTKGCFAKLENKTGNDCVPPTGNSGALQALTDACVISILAVETATTTTTTTAPPGTTTTTTTPPGLVLKGSLPATVGRFNYNLTLGLPGANSACNSNFAGTHACTYAELQSAETAGDLDGLKDTMGMTVTRFWVIDGSAPALEQCNDDALGGSGLNWEYGTAHTPSRGRRVDLTNATGALGLLQTGVQCNIAGNSWVGCCQ